MAVAVVAGAVVVVAAATSAGNSFTTPGGVVNSRVSRSPSLKSSCQLARCKRLPKGAISRIFLFKGTQSNLKRRGPDRAGQPSLRNRQVAAIDFPP